MRHEIGRLQLTARHRKSGERRKQTPTRRKWEKVGESGRKWEKVGESGRK